MAFRQTLGVLRRLRRVSSPQLFHPHSQTPNPLVYSPNKSQSQYNPFSSYISSRFFSIHSPTTDNIICDTHSYPNDVPSEVTDTIVGVDEWYDPFVNTLISVLDTYHDVTGLPWWFVIASSTLALRVAIFPLLILQLQKLNKFSELMPFLPPPFPPPLSGKSYITQYLHFRKEKEAIGCPSALWGLAFLSVQVPCFLLGVTSVRKMSFDHHPGFDCGGTLWFQNLTETPHGVLGAMFPILIAGLHFSNVQVSFKMSKKGIKTGVISMLATLYKGYLNVLTIPIFIFGFFMPQGSLVYWFTNSSLTLVQQLCLQNPLVRGKLGLPDINTLRSRETPRFKTPETGLSGTLRSRETPRFDTSETGLSGTEMTDKPSVQSLPPDELVPLSVKFLAKGDRIRAIPLLRLALQKDPEYVRALVLLGQALMQQKRLTEAAECLELAVSKLLRGGRPTSDESVDLLILAYMWAGSTSIKQGNMLAGLEHLQRIAQMREPEDRLGKSHYFDGLTFLASALDIVGRKGEAVEVLRRAVAYDHDKYNVYLQQCLEDSDYDQTISDNKK